jgi:flagellar FliL protein
MSSPELQLSADPVPKKRKGKLLPMLLALVVIGGGGGAYWWLNRGLVEAAPKITPLAERGLIAFEPFMVNLSDGGGTRFLKVSLQLVMEDEAAAAKVGESPVVSCRRRTVGRHMDCRDA